MRGREEEQGHPIPLIRAPQRVGVGRKEPVQRAALASGSALLHFLWQDGVGGRGEEGGGVG